ncbi:hypothetical protein VIA_001218 [Vibrio orientalis CIP 102891 = ATCC 33934]|uniref:Uncharacterized protein n=1 Tax=Vibrio orientalis CIP 102891 = ATCC 33934 TaxID=675816 RepID=A0ABP2H2B8_VIBOR|nr:hypothetical protein VIA_001218 [Vibrio orientalis CIP 102891 = ATCC 33934]
MNFGGVHTVRRYSSLLFALLITASANATVFEQALADYGDKLISP